MSGLSDFIEAYEAYDGDDVSVLIHEWELRLGIDEATHVYQPAHPDLGIGDDCGECGWPKDVCSGTQVEQPVSEFTTIDGRTFDSSLNEVGVNGS